MICPATGSRRPVLLLHVRNHLVAQLRPEAQVVDRVRERVRLVAEVVVQVVHMEIAVGKGFARRNVEVSNDFVDADGAGKTAALAALLVELLGVVLALALLDVLAAAKRPRDGGIRFADFVAGLATAGFDRIGG